MKAFSILVVLLTPPCYGFLNLPKKMDRNTKCRQVVSSSKDVFGQQDSLDAMFDKYDADGNGSIDKQEFRAVAKKMNDSARRREFISVATATFGSIFVAEKSNTFQFAQKNLRSRYLEEFAEAAQNELFPLAMLSGDVDKAVYKTLHARGFTPENTIFGHSVCSDEVNNRAEQLIPLMINRWQEGFTLGGLGGLPFAGKSGFGAYLHHVPDNGEYRGKNKIKEAG